MDCRPILFDVSVHYGHIIKLNEIKISSHYYCFPTAERLSPSLLLTCKLPYHNPSITHCFQTSHQTALQHCVYYKIFLKLQIYIFVCSVNKEITSDIFLRLGRNINF